MHLSSDHLLFLARLSKSPDGQALLRILEAKAEDLAQKLLTTEGAEVHRTQGRALELRELMDEIRSAERSLTRVQPAARPRL